jgi:hypothetical protein
MSEKLNLAWRFGFWLELILDNGIAQKRSLASKVAQSGPNIVINCFFGVAHLNMDAGLGAGIDAGMALTPFPSIMVLDEIRTHDLPIVSQVRKPLERTFAI